MSRRRYYSRQAFGSAYPSADAGAGATTGSSPEPIIGTVNLVSTSFDLEVNDTDSLVLSRDDGIEGAIAADYLIEGSLDETNILGIDNAGTVYWAENEGGEVAIEFTVPVTLSDISFTITISNVRRTDNGSGTPDLGVDTGSGTVSAGEPGTIALSAATYAADEGGYFTLAANLTGGTNGLRTVDWAIEAGVNADPASGTFTWQPGESGTQSIIIDVGDVSADTDVDITLSNFTGTPAPTEGLSLAVLTVTEKPMITIYESGVNFDTAWMEDFGIIRDEIVYMDELFPDGGQTDDWSVIDTDWITSVASAYATAGKTRAILDVERLGNHATSDLYDMVGSLSDPIIPPDDRPSGVTALIQIVNAFRAGFGSGEIGLYNPADISGEYNRVLLGNGDTDRAADMQAYQRVIYADMAPLFEVLDFYVISMYGPWAAFDPDYTGPGYSYTSYVPALGATEVEAAQAIWGPAITTAWDEALLAIGDRTRVSWFFKTTAQNKDIDGNDIPNTIVRAPYQILEWFFDEIVARIPEGRREVNIWSGPYNSIGASYWTSVEGSAFLGYGGNLLPFHATHEGAYVVVTDDIQVNENGTFAVTVARVSAQTSNSPQTVYVNMQVGATTVQQLPIVFGDGVSGELSTANFTASAVSTDTTYTFSIVPPYTWQTDPYINGGTVTVLNVPIPGTVNWVDAPFSVDEGGSTTIYARRTLGFDGEITVPYTVSFSGATILSPISGNLVWTNGNATDQAIVINGLTVGANTDCTITLGAGSGTQGAPTIGTAAATITVVNDAGAPAAPGTISFVDASITVTEGEALDFNGFTRTNGTSGVVSTWYQVSDGLATCSWGTAGYVQFAGGSTTPVYSPSGATANDPPVWTAIANVESDTPGTITMSSATGGPAYGPNPIVLTVENTPPVSTDYTLDTVSERFSIPFAYAEPALPTLVTNPNRDVTPQTIAQYTGAFSAAANGLRLNFQAGNYGDLTLSGNNQEWIFTTGVNIGRITGTGTAAYVRMAANPPRSGSIKRFLFGSTSGAVPHDIILDGINQYQMDDNQYNSADACNYNVDKFAILNSSLQIRGWLIVAFASNHLSHDWVIANNQLIDAGYSDLGLPSQTNFDPGPSMRFQGLSRLVMVDNRSYANPDEKTSTGANNGRGHLRLHGEHTVYQVTEDFFIAKNQFEGTGHSFQRTGDGIAAAELTKIYYQDNLQFTSYTQPINVFTAATHWPTLLTITGNTLYSATGNYPSIPTGYAWTVSGNSYNARTRAQVDALAAAAAAEWDFDGWNDPASWRYIP